jgi:hypothetical protein
MDYGRPITGVQMKNPSDIIAALSESASMDEATEILNGSAMPAEMAEIQWHTYVVDLHRLCFFTGSTSSLTNLERGFREHQKECQSKTCICSSPLMMDLVKKFHKFVADQKDLLGQIFKLAAETDTDPSAEAVEITVAETESRKKINVNLN